MVTVHFSLRTVTESNTGGHWAAKAKRAKWQRNVTRLLVLGQMAREPWPYEDSPVSCKLVRISRGAIRDSDNLASSLKHVRDGVADALGMSDADLGESTDRIVWRYAQEHGQHSGVRIELETL
jgi:hypothetical protein